MEEKDSNSKSTKIPNYQEIINNSTPDDAAKALEVMLDTCGQNYNLLKEEFRKSLDENKAIILRLIDEKDALKDQLAKANEVIKVLTYDNNKLKGEVEGLKKAVEELKGQPGAVWVKASEFNKKQGKHYCGRTKSEAGDYLYATIYWNHKGERFVNFSIEGRVEFEILDESPTATLNPELLQVIRDAEKSKEDDLKAVKEVIGGEVAAGKLTQSRADLIREANNRDLGGTAGREEAVEFWFAKWATSNHWRWIEGLQVWKNPMQDVDQVTTVKLYELFKQQKEK